MNKQDPTKRTIIESWHETSPQFGFTSTERGVFSLLLADYVWDVTKPMRQTIVSTKAVTGEKVKEVFEATPDGGLTVKRCEAFYRPPSRAACLV